jgi:AraC-like DNA-binding protein
MPGAAPADDTGSPDRRPLDAILFESAAVTIGSFRVAPDDPRFHDSGPIENDVFVFPRTAVWIRHAGSDAFAANPNVITLYNRGQTYRRDRISAIGDCCEWFALSPEIVAEAAARFAPAVADARQAPFPTTHVHSDPRLFLQARLLVHDLLTAPAGDELRVEEVCIELLHAVLASAYRNSRTGRRCASRTEMHHRALAEDVAAWLAVAYRRRDGLAQLARMFDVSPGHLCRVFRRHTGQRLHRYRDELRLRAAAEEVLHAGDLTALALDLGYSSHSHFTAAFRRTFSTVPADVRRVLRARSRN